MGRKRIFAISLLLLLSFCTIYAQTELFTRQDSIRGSGTPEREWWNLTWYHLNVSVSPSDILIKGSDEI